MRRLFFLLVLLVVFVGLAVVSYNYFSPKIYHTALALSYNSHQLPLVDIEIAKKGYRVVVDLGASRPLSLQGKDLEALPKMRYGTSCCINFWGDIQEEPSYLISAVKLGSLIFDDFVVTKKEASEGYLGWFFLKKVNVLLDHVRSMLYVSNDKAELLKEGYDLSAMIKVPLIKSKGLVVEVMTDFGRRKVMIDTGSTINVLKSVDIDSPATPKESFGMPERATSHFLLNGYDFGPLTFHLCDFAFTTVDGIMGMAFLKNHVVYIDYDAGFIYFQKPAQ